jgi:hypothetical protein
MLGLFLVLNAFLYYVNGFGFGTHYWIMIGFGFGWLETHYWIIIKFGTHYWIIIKFGILCTRAFL